MNKEYTIEDYIIKNPKDAHIKLYIQLKLDADEDEFHSITDDMVLNFDLGGIRYSLTMGELKQKCREESDNYHNDDDGEEHIQ